jgi:S-adenosylmethionine:tRNA ribosyltransferase-isomerase
MGVAFWFGGDALMLMEELDYELPAERIATHPAEPRDASRLMVVRRGSEGVEHRRFFELPAFLRARELMVVNDTRVIPAKLLLHKTTGGAIPGLFLAEKEVGLWEVMLRSRGRVKEGAELVAGAFRFLLERRVEGEKGTWEVRVMPAAAAGVVLAAIGHVPLPPYIEKQREGEGDESRDVGSYQTVYAREGKSLAAPTAGLHFTPELLQRIEAMGVRRAAVDLEVGLGTFLPVETETLEAHPMHVETYSVPAGTVAAIREQRANGGRIVVVGTTAVRTLEATASRILDLDCPPTGMSGSTDLKISPGYRFALTDVLITNFHLPRSTLMALVGAMVGVERLKELYALAVREGYRFYSYGDAMLILP